ncbi:MAG TPA: helix-turn-helix domain-containing protein [Pirellulales bacterium]|nr:helix-turn-helix domain-containing protein [Pirellulales bacterium]
MASKFLSLEEAANLLGISTDALTELRLRQEIYGYRDGASWKFKPEDVDRIKQSRASGGASPSSIGSASGDDLLPIDLASEDDDGIHLSDIKLGGTGGSSTVIGQSAKPGAAPDSGLKLTEEEFVPGSGLGSGLALGSGTGSGLNLSSDTGSGLALGSDAGSGLHLSGGSDALASAGPGSDAGPGSGLGLGNDVAMGSSLGLGSDIILVSADERGPSSDVRGPSSDVVLAPPDDDVLSSPSELPIDLAESPTMVKSGSELALGESALIGGPGMVDLSGAPSGGSSLLGGDILLLADEDVLGGAGSGGSGSDITHRPSDSGILLIDPSDSGLSLDKPIDLSGSDAMLQTTDFTASESAELKADDDFLLTPLEEAAEDESDSGSQVIMLDTEGEFDDATATLLASQIPGLNSSLLVEEESPLGGLGGMGGEAPVARGPAMGGAGQVMVPAQPEVQFSAFSVAGLAVCSIALVICGIMMYDVVRNMWSWDSPYGVDSVILKTLIK